LVRRLHAGIACRAEDLLATLPPGCAEDDSVLELVYTEYVVRQELGQTPDPAEWYTRFPRLRQRLERLFHVGELLRVESRAEVATVLTAPWPADAGAGAEPADAAPWLDHYELLELLGVGGMGVVHKARQIGLGRIVALKRIKEGSDARPEELASFRCEARAMARLQHPNIVPIYAVGECNGLPCFSMEYLEGGNLTRRIAGQPQPARQTAVWMEALAQAVHYAHQQGIIHRDLKPANVLLTRDGTPKISDFGLAKNLEAELGTSRSSSSGPADVPIGTPGYSAPEQVARSLQEIGPRSDVFSLGAIMYELLTGRPAFQAVTPPEALRRVLEQEPTPPRQLHRGVDPELEAVCLKCLEKKPADRYPSAAALADDLGRWLRGKPTLARPRRWLTRAWYFVRRHPILSTIAAQLLLAALVVPLVLYFADPERRAAQRAAQIDRDLVENRPAVIIGEFGAPPRFQLATNPADSQAWVGPDGTFTVMSFKIALVQLLADPKRQRYRFRAEVRHDATSYDTEVGIYCLHSAHTTAKGEPAHGFCSLSFNDLWFRRPQQGNQVNLMLRRYVEQNHWPPSLKIGLLQEHFPPAGETAGATAPWRQLAVEVTPEEIRATWEGMVLQAGREEKVSREKLTEEARWLAEYDKDPIPELKARLDPQDGLGLFVYKGRASFRRVVIEPLD
jgi:serine/threonine-protein kinase